MHQTHGSSTRALLFLLAAVLLLMLAAWFFWPRPAPVSVPIIPAAADSAAPDAAASAAPKLARFDPHAPAPEPGPLPSLAALVSAADGGDARAACQLAAEFDACGHADWLDGKPRLSRELLDDQARLLAQLPQDQFHARMQPMEARFRCQQLGELHGDRHFDWLRQAAMAGEPEAMLRYASGEAFGSSFGGDFSYLGSPDFDIWRREAPGMLEALLEAGYADALVFLARSGDPLLGGHMAALFAPDPLRERAYLHLMALLTGREPVLQAALARIQDLHSGVDVEANALARQWHQAYFDGVVLDPERPASRGQSCSQPVPGVRK